MKILPFGSAPTALGDAYELVCTVNSTEAALKAKHASEDAIFVYGAALSGQPGVYEFARFRRKAARRMMGFVDTYELTHGGLGNQYTTIGGVRYITYWDFWTMDWKIGDCIEFDAVYRSLWNDAPLTLHAENINKCVPGTIGFSCYVQVTGDATAQEDQGVQGVYEIAIALARPVHLDTMADVDKVELAEAVLDSFHDHQGIKVLDDFEVTIILPNGVHIVGDDSPTSGLVRSAEHLGKINESELPKFQLV